ncbi:NAD-dependent deacetylase [Alloscardovia theropitheci]|uniref:protein acetyllysine N-acetyltransferase n=1 Tax=Alloscardovia theropitheci TaxID=2496842 RepID=A0A4R0QT51_9BIFI|nr:Sir2 family NAD-dependent protein deacetylase [Alloscardovia theropitheci]TCD54375.1 NAD-dependent deacetylase [Alloscardovia theropitheci]
MSIAVFTGAGISTSVGIPDFRGPDGVWTKHPEQTDVYDYDLFISNRQAREYSWRWQKESAVWNAQPGPAHKALVELENAGVLSIIATQNFDGLHERAGNSAEKISNLHGTIASSHCLNCGAAYNTADIMSTLDDTPAPRCSLCHGILKTDVTYFGEQLPEGALEKGALGISQADELWVIGSSLEVYPAASLVPYAAQLGKRIRIINAQPTGMDELAKASDIIREPIEIVLPQLVHDVIEDN